ncbi:MAG: calcium-binding protein [Microcoleus sp.]
MTTLDDNANQIDLNIPGLGPDTIFAGAGADFIKTSTLGGSLIFGQDDNDTLVSVGPNDSLYGGNGEDSITSQRTPAWLYGEAGNDTIVAQARATMLGGDGDDFMQAIAEANLMFGNQGNDTMLGGAVGRDSLYGGKGNDSLGFFKIGGGNNLDFTLSGGSGGNQGSNYLRGDLGDDLLVGIGVRDSLFGGKGNDTVEGVASNSYLSGDDGDDILSVTNPTQENTFTGSTVTLTIGVGKVTLLGGAGNDTIIGGYGDSSSGKNFFDGGDGNDTITVFATQDTALGGAGNDFIQSITVPTTTLSLINPFNPLFNPYGQNNGGKSSLDGGAGNDTIVGGYASDTILGGADNDSLSGIFSLGSGGDGNDAINASGNFGTTPISITLDGGLGNDHLVGNVNAGTVTNFMNGGAGDDTIIFGSTGDKLIGDFAGNDFISYSSVSFTGSTTNIITDNLGNNFIDGGSGTDSITTGDGIDVLFGRAGNDTLDAGGGNDTLFGDVGNDYLIGGDGNDSLGGAIGADTLIGGAGNDSFYYNNFGEGVTIDSITGGLGTNPDQIGDFTPGQDKLIFQSSQFVGLGVVSVPSRIGSQQFFTLDTGTYTGTETGLSSGASLIYEAANGRLLYDTDGKGGQDPIYLALLAGTPSLTVNDITLI